MKLLTSKTIYIRNQYKILRRLIYNTSEGYSKVDLSLLTIHDTYDQIGQIVVIHKK